MRFSPARGAEVGEFHLLGVTLQSKGSNISGSVNVFMKGVYSSRSQDNKKDCERYEREKSVCMFAGIQQ